MGKQVPQKSIDELLAKGVRFYEKGENVEAARIFRRVLRFDPTNANAPHLLALLYGKWGNLDRAIKLLRAAIALTPKPNAAMRTNLGTFLHRRGDFGQALEQFRKAIELEPGFDLPRLNLATTLRALGEIDQAILALEAAHETCAESAEVCFELGTARLERKRLDEALLLFKGATQLNPNRAESWFRLSLVYARMEDRAATVKSLFEVLRLDPSHDVARANLASELTVLARADQSEIYLLELLKTSPCAEVFSILGTVYKDLGYIDLAMDCYAKALDMSPSVADYQNFLYTLLYDPSFDDEEVAQEHRDWAKQFAEPLRPAVFPRCFNTDPDRAIRIGYVSGHFRDHAVSLFSRPMILAHDRSKFHITCYASGVAKDAIAAELKNFAQQWRDISVMDDDAAAKTVRDDKIDILIDLAGHIGGNRLLLFARKPAPIQMTYLGYQHTTGMSVMDYRITDSVADPPGATDRLYVEKLMRLDPSFFVYAPSDYAPEVVVPPSLEKGCVTFGCMNNPTKHGATVVAVWAELLRAVPNSQLILLGPTAYDADPRVAKLFDAHGIDSQRVRFIGKRTRTVYLSNYAEIDICLDPFPFSGHTTTCDALWQGVPVVTLAGKTYASRMSTSTLTQAKFPQWIASTPEQYISIASKLAEDRTALATLRGSMRQHLSSAPILDAAGFTRSLEAAYREVWQERCALERG